MKYPYLALDCEMGGIGLNTSLLTACFDKYTKDFVKGPRLYLRLKPDADLSGDTIYRVTARGMEVNGINLVEHDKVAMPYKKAVKILGESKTVGQILYGFLSEDFPTRGSPEAEKERYTVVGHQVKGDIQHVTDKVMNPDTWQIFCSYRLLDTAALAAGLMAAGVLVMDEAGGLAALVKHYGLGEQPKTGHDAGQDNDFTVGVLRCMLDSIRPT